MIDSMRSDLEIIYFIFDNSLQRDFWFMTTNVALFKDILYSNRRRKIITLPEAKYVFTTNHELNRSKPLHYELCYSYKELVIILNDFERTKLETYVENSEHDYSTFRSLI